MGLLGMRTGTGMCDGVLGLCDAECMPLNCIGLDLMG